MSKNPSGQSWKERLSLREENLSLHLLGFGIAVAIAAICLTTFLMTLIEPQTGWQALEVLESRDGIAGDFVLNYEIGASGMKADKERKAVIAAYTDALNDAYAALSNAQIAGVNNLHTLNAHPNEPFQVDRLLYDALSMVESSGSRQLYYAPIAAQYHSIFLCQTDEDAQLFDPAYDAETADYVAQLAQYANNPSMIQLELLPDGKVQLNVGEEYLAFARENELDALVDFGILRNAFLCDAVADALEKNGFCNGMLSSWDGYTRVLCSEHVGVNLFDWQEGQLVQISTANYTGPAAVVSLRSFPILERERYSYYTYADGAVRSLFLTPEGSNRTAGSSLVVYSGQGSAAQLALRAVEAFTHDAWPSDALRDASWLLVHDRQVDSYGTGLLLG